MKKEINWRDVVIWILLVLAFIIWISSFFRGVE